MSIIFEEWSINMGNPHSYIALISERCEQDNTHNYTIQDNRIWQWAVMSLFFVHPFSLKVHTRVTCVKGGYLE